MIITAGSGPCQGVVGTAPIPIDWPEQKATVVEEDFSPSAKVSYQMVSGTVKQMVVQVPYLPAGQECRAVVTLRVERHAQIAPDDPSKYLLPSKRFFFFALA